MLGRAPFEPRTQNETGPNAGRFIYRTHEISTNGQVSVTDLETNVTQVLAQRADWERLDGIAWTPWGTILVAEEVITSAVKDPALPAALGGRVYEINPETGAAVLRDAVGSRSHEGLRFDAQGNLYGISEASPSQHTAAFVYDYVRAGLNAPAGNVFDSPDNLALDKSGNLYITEDPSVNPVGQGADVWVAPPSNGGPHQPSDQIERFTSLTDCTGKPTGIYFDQRGSALFVHAQHRGGDGIDYSVKIERVE